MVPSALLDQARSHIPSFVFLIQISADIPCVVLPLQLADQQEEERRLEEEASNALIQRLCSSEELESEEVRRQQEAIAARDAQLALKLERAVNEVHAHRCWMGLGWGGAAELVYIGSE